MYTIKYPSLFILLILMVVGANPGFADDKNDVNNTDEKTVRAIKNPKACFEVTPTSGNITENQPLQVNVDASCSTGKNIVDYKWEINGYPNKQQGSQPIFFLNNKGNNIIALKIFNSKGNSDFVIKEIMIGELIAKAKVQPNTVTLKDTIALDATESEGGFYSTDQLEYKWNVNPVSNNEAECQTLETGFDDNTAAKATLSFWGSMDKNTLCEFIVLLTVTSPDQVVAKDSVTVTVAPSIISPIAQITAVSSISGLAPLTLTLDGSDSYDPDGVVVRYTWVAVNEDSSFSFEKSSYSAITTMILEKTGNYKIHLFVTDNDGWKSELAVFEKPIELYNELPVAMMNILLTEKPLEVILDGNQSYDEDGLITQYTWLITNDDGFENTFKTDKATIAHIFEKNGFYTFKLVVTDNNDANSEPDEITNFNIDGTLVIDRQSHSFSLPEAFVTLNASNQKSSPEGGQSSDKQLTTTRRLLQKSEYWQGRVIVKFREGTPTKKKVVLRNHYHAKFIKALLPINGEVWQIEDVEAAIAQHRHPFSEIVSITPDYVISANDIKSMTYNSENMWRRNNRQNTDNSVSIETKEPVLCAVIDSGVDYDHNDLKSYIWTNPGEIPNNDIDDDNNGYIDDVHGYDFVNDDGDPMDDCGHGTHVAGILAGVAEPDGKAGVTLTGIGWPAKIIALKILKPELLSGQCVGSQSDAILALEYVQKNADKMGIKCTNNSWGGNFPYEQILANAIETEANDGRLFIAAAGNNYVKRHGNDDLPHYPASYKSDNIISVCSIDNENKLSIFSNFGKQSVDLCALGERIVSTYPSNGHNKDNGTSMATAYVTGTVTLLLSAFPDLTMSELKTHILASAKPVSTLKDFNLTGGRLSLRNAITYMKSRRQTFIISNTGNTSLNINQVKITGKDPEAFQVRNNDCLFKQLNPGKGCSVELFFAPISKGNTNAFLEVSSNTPVPQTTIATLRGNVSDINISSTSMTNFEEAPPLSPLMELAQSSVYYIETGELKIQKIVLLEDKMDTGIAYQATLSLLNEPLYFQLVELKEIKTFYKSGDPTFNTTTGILNLPLLEVVGMGSRIFYEVDMRLMINSDGTVQFEIMEIIPIH
jgi:subtilisin family serine protease